jgi:preprotein translocase subunit YajC
LVWQLRHAAETRLIADLTNFMLSLFLAQAQPAQPGGAPGQSPLLTFAPFWILIFVIFYFVMIRPQKKRQQEQQRLMSSLKTGDRVVTSAGIHGLIANVKETTVMLKVADNVKIEMEKSAITNVIKPSESGETIKQSKTQ